LIPTPNVEDDVVTVLIPPEPAEMVKLVPCGARGMGLEITVSAVNVVVVPTYPTTCLIST
jgi:tartrate dehydratase alpha subunit/fumarate hydratase class I-like protein